jgi:arabinose-5-phosphate isomerase
MAERRFDRDGARRRVAARSRRLLTEDSASHPAVVGRKLVRVDDLMHTGDEVPSVRETSSLKEVLVEMTSKRLGMTAVLDDGGALVGVVTDGDLRRGLERTADVRTLTARELMSRAPKTVQRTTLAGQALALMERHKITTLVVLEDGSRVAAGVLHLHDLLRAGIV